MSAILLDAMGTLVAMEPPAPLLAAELAARTGAQLSAAEAEAAVRAEIGYYRAHMLRGSERGLAELWRDCACELRAALPERVAEVLSVEGAVEALRGMLAFHAYEDAAPALRELRAAGHALVVCSNWDAGLPAVLDRCGLLELVDGVVASAAIGAAKPERAIFAAALEHAGATAAQALHVGDDLRNDVEGARGAGIEPVLVERDPSRPVPPGVRAIASLAPLPALAATYSGRPRP